MKQKVHEMFRNVNLYCPNSLIHILSHQIYNNLSTWQKWIGCPEMLYLFFKRTQIFIRIQSKMFRDFKGLFFLTSWVTTSLRYFQLIFIVSESYFLPPFTLKSCFFFANQREDEALICPARIWNLAWNGFRAILRHVWRCSSVSLERYLV